MHSFSVFSEPLSISGDSPIITEKGKNAGKFRSVIGKYGIGLLRLAHVKESLFISSLDGHQIPVTSYIPSWWPDDH